MKTRFATPIKSAHIRENNNLRDDDNHRDNVSKFISAIESAMEGPLIRYSRRVRLLELAEKLGIERFEANLLIAQTQRRYMKTGEKSTESDNVIGAEISQKEKEKSTFKEKLFIAATIFIIAALTDMILIRYLFKG